MATFQGLPIEFVQCTDADIVRVCATVPIWFWKQLDMKSHPIVTVTGGRYITVGCLDGATSAQFDRSQLPVDDDATLLAVIVAGLAVDSYKGRC